MGKLILLILLLAAAICGSCASDMCCYRPMQPGDKYLFINNWGTEQGIVKFDTVQVVGIDRYCLKFCYEGKEYWIAKKKFERRIYPINGKAHL